MNVFARLFHFVSPFCVPFARVHSGDGGTDIVSPGARSSYLLLVVRPGAPSRVRSLLLALPFAPSSDTFSLVRIILTHPSHFSSEDFPEFLRLIN